jgi:hypothetical protein
MCHLNPQGSHPAPLYMCGLSGALEQGVLEGRPGGWRNDKRKTMGNPNSSHPLRHLQGPIRSASVLPLTKAVVSPTAEIPTEEGREIYTRHGLPRLCAWACALQCNTSLPHSQRLRWRLRRRLQWRRSGDASDALRTPDAHPRPPQASPPTASGATPTALGAHHRLRRTPCTACTLRAVRAGQQ